MSTGQVASAFADVLVALPDIRSGAVRALDVSSPARHPQLPEVPTMQETGLAGFEATSWQGVFAAAGTPAPALDRLQAKIARAMAAPWIRTTFAHQGFIVESTSPADFVAFVPREVTKWTDVVRAGNVRAD